MPSAPSHWCSQAPVVPVLDQLLVTSRATIPDIHCVKLQNTPDCSVPCESNHAVSSMFPIDRFRLSAVSLGPRSAMLAAAAHLPDQL